MYISPKKLETVGRNVHQGDVLVHKLSNDIMKHTGDSVKSISKRLIVQHGEAMGHYHALDEQEGVTLSILPSESAVKKFLLTTTKEIILGHGDLTLSDPTDTDVHDGIVITPGSYEIHTQQAAQGEFLRPVMD